MAVGKSTIGLILARRLQLPFVDLDLAVEEAAGQPVQALFEQEGEVGFRLREAEALRRVLAGPDIVLALGGGTLHHGHNLARVLQRFPLVVLDLPWPELAHRLEWDPSRPLATEARRLWEARRAGYQEAGVVVDIAGLDPEAAAAAVLERL